MARRWVKLGEREVLTAMLEVDAALIAERESILLIADKGSASAPFEKELAGQGITLLRPSRDRSPVTRSLIAFDH